MLRLLAPLLLLIVACAPAETEGRLAAMAPTADGESNVTSPDETAPTGEALATFGAGCFWCVEAVLEQLDGVLDVQSGYMGGRVSKPTYEQVCSGASGHAEVVQVRFDQAVISYDELLSWFWRLHDPTTLNRQGADVGTQYRSAIFAHDDAQLQAAKASAEAAQSSFSDAIVTEITPASQFWSAEAYHQDYYQQNRAAGYCQIVIAPKLDKLGLDK